MLIKIKLKNSLFVFSEHGCFTNQSEEVHIIYFSFLEASWPRYILEQIGWEKTTGLLPGSIFYFLSGLVAEVYFKMCKLEFLKKPKKRWNYSEKKECKNAWEAVSEGILDRSNLMLPKIVAGGGKLYMELWEQQ